MRWFLGISLIFIASTANAASFDCSKATSETEIAICNSEYLSFLDEAMAAAYRERKEDTDVEQAQREWIRDVQAPCGSNENCLVEAYQSRFDDYFLSAVDYFQETAPLYAGACTNAPEDSPTYRYITMNNDSVTPLYEAICWMAAYQEGYLYSANEDIIALASPVFKDDSNQIIGFWASTTASMGSFDEISQTLTSHNKFRGLNDCFSAGEWTFDGNNFILQSYKQDSLCDEKIEINQTYYANGDNE